tara:strand:+ start:151 stop:402 length:252 start_codon:yes stop_codon:yes gene_type:complete
MYEEEKESNSLLNTSGTQPNMNKGFELMLRSKKRRNNQEISKKQKSFRVTFDKVISLFNREIHFHFDTFLDIKKQSSRGKRQC